MKPQNQAVAERPWILLSLLVAGLVHITAVLAMPQLAENDAFARLARISPLNHFSPLPRPAPGAEVVPYNDPATAEGVCRYDLSEGPLRLRARLVSDAFVSLSFHTHDVGVYYSLTDRAATRETFDILLVTAEQRSAVEAKDTEGEPPPELRVTAPGLQGFVFARALAPFPSAYDVAAGQIAQMTCAIDSSIGH